MPHLQKSLFFVAVTAAASALFLISGVTRVMDITPNLLARMKYEQMAPFNSSGGFPNVAFKTSEELQQNEEATVTAELPKHSSFSSAQPNQREWELMQRLRRIRLKTGCSFLSKTLMYNIPPLEALSKGKKFSMANLLVDDEHKALYCYIPKVACTQWKKLLMVLAGRSKLEDVENISNVKVHYMSGLKALIPFFFKKEEILKRLKTYKKFLIVRHPIERLLSAYRNKFAANTSDARNFKKIYAIQMMSFARNASNVPPLGDGMTFQEFLLYLTSHPAKNFQEHWSPYLYLCHPCTINYDFIGAYETLETDSNHILRMLNAPSDLKFPPFRLSSTQKELHKVLQSIPAELREKVFQTYLPDYTLFGYKKDPP